MSSVSFCTLTAINKRNLSFDQCLLGLLDYTLAHLPQVTALHVQGQAA